MYGEQVSSRRGSVSEKIRMRDEGRAVQESLPDHPREHVSPSSVMKAVLFKSRFILHPFCGPAAAA